MGSFPETQTDPENLSHAFRKLHSTWFQVDNTVETHLTATSVILSVTSLFRQLFFSARQNGHTFSYEKPSLMQSPVNAANAHILKCQTVESFEFKLAGPDISMILYCF